MALTKVTTGGITDATIATADIADAAVTTAKINNGNVTTAKIADDAVNAAKLQNTGVNPASYGSSTSIPSITVDAQGRITAASGNTVNTDLVGDTSPQLGGALDTNGNQIVLGDGGPGNSDQNICFGTDKDLKIYHDGANSAIYDNGGGRLKLYSNGAGIDLQKDDGEYMVKANTDGVVELYHDNTMRLETANNGIQVNNTSGTSVVRLKGYGSSSGAARFGDILMNQNMTIRTVYGDHLIFNTNQVDRAYFHATSGHFLPNSNNTYDLGSTSQRWRNIYTNDLHLSNEGHSNDVDGTWGNWTIQEGESDLFLKNNRSGKKYKFSLTEVS